MKKIALFFFFFTTINIVIAQNKEFLNLDSNRLISLAKKYNSSEKLLRNYLAKFNADSTISDTAKKQFIKFMDTLIITLVNTKSEYKNPMDEYLAKHDLSILDPLSFTISNKDILRYEVYSDLGFLKRELGILNTRDSLKIFKHIDTIQATYTIVVDNMKKEYFSNFSIPHRNYINSIMQQCYELLTEYDEAKKMKYSIKSKEEKAKLKSDFRNKKLLKGYSYFLYLDFFQKQ